MLDIKIENGKIKRCNVSQDFGTVYSDLQAITGGVLLAMLEVIDENSRDEAKEILQGLTCYWYKLIKDYNGGNNNE